MTRVLPLPAPARISTGPSVASTALSCSGLSSLAKSIQSYQPQKAQKHKTFCAFCASLWLFHRNTFGEISRLVDIAATPHRAMISEQLQRYHFENRKQIFI